LVWSEFGFKNDRSFWFGIVLGFILLENLCFSTELAWIGFIFVVFTKN